MNKTTLRIFRSFAAFWFVHVLYEVIHKSYNNSMPLFCIKVLCAVLCICIYYIISKKYGKTT